MSTKYCFKSRFPLLTALKKILPLFKHILDAASQGAINVEWMYQGDAAAFVAS